ncbi:MULTISPECIES: hypothetical protein [Williamsia]|uniref:hypothetical protein n=1 Tax=Williamsia TaxID=85043 RepID=UPI0003D377D6|nr:MULTISPECIES: hypothetical protein [Williamsia]ETD34346.1 hypothetical protein W823_03085 [Williamsia sp. D3]PVY22392.1 hypothetical protein C7458_13120 [Williamsia marianensis]
MADSIKDTELAALRETVKKLDEAKRTVNELLTQRDIHLLAAKKAGASWKELQQDGDLTPGGLRKVLQRHNLL